MALFERKIERKVTDDTLHCTIEIVGSLTKDGHTEYVLRVQRGFLKENSWKVQKRYNDFATLDKDLHLSGVELPFPAKKFIGNMQPQFIAQRLKDLQIYINTILMNPILASSLPTKKFIDPDSYTVPFHDTALQNASLCLRTDGQYALGQSVGPIGWRLRKHYFKVSPRLPNVKNSPGHQTSATGKHLVKSSSQTYAKPPSNGGTGHHHHHQAPPVDTNLGPNDFLLAWSEFGPDKFVDDKEMHGILKTLTSLQHPYIQQIEHVTSNDNGALVIRRFIKQGSLKDYLCGVQPLNPFLSKYGNPKGRAPLALKDVALYGRQVLEAIRFLHSKGIPHGHIHCGNVIVIDGEAKLCDIENFVLGVPSFYRPFFVQHSKIHTFEAIDVYSFGHLVYEMCMGYPLQESTCRQITDCPDVLRTLLESILTKDACRVGLPTLDQVAMHPFFTEFVPDFDEKCAKAQRTNRPQFRLSTNAKELFCNAITKAENRLRDEQKSVRNQKRLVRVQEMMSSEEEKKKIKHKAKLEQKQSKLRQQNSLQLNNGPPFSPLVRSDSASSISTSHGTSGRVIASPPCPPPIPPPGGKFVSKTTDDIHLGGSSGSTSTTQAVPVELGRSVLLDSICKFNKNNLRRIVSED